MSVEEWDALPWWHRKMYKDGFREQGIIKGGAPTSLPGDDLAHAKRGQFAKVGFKERTVVLKPRPSKD